MTQMNTPTPRTDAAWAKTFLDDDDQCRAGNAATDMRDECATLERELAAAKERLRSEAMDDYASIKDLQRELATEREKVRVLRLACERLRDCDWVISLPDRMDAVREIAREALKKMEGAK